MSTQQEPSAWKKTILAAMTSYIDAGSIVALHEIFSREIEKFDDF